MTPNQIRLVGFLSLPCGRDTRPTTPRPFTAGVFIVRALFTAAILLTLAASAQAQTNYTWDPGNSASGGTDGSGNWGTSAGDWYTTSDAQDWANIASTSANNAIFGEGGTTTNIVTLNTQIDVGLMTFQSMGTGGSYSVSTSFTNSLTIYSGVNLNSGAGPVTVSSSSGTGVSLGAANTWANNSLSLLTVSSNITNSTFGLTIGGSGNTTISGIISGGSGGVTMSGAGTLTLSGANAFTGGLHINSGTAVAGASGAAGSSSRAITLGASDGSNAATLLANSFTISNAITLGTTSGTLTIGTNGGATQPTFSGGVTGSNNLTLNDNGTGALSFSTFALNNSGAITNSGSGSGATTISGGVGGNVTAIVENSTTSALTISGQLAVNSTSGTALINSSGTALLKLTGGTPTGAGSLILENNSATAGGVTISTGTVSNKVVTNSGTGTGSVLISAAISSGGIIENSSASALTISGQLTAASGGGTTLTNSSGTSLLTLSGSVTGQILTLDNNSATAGGITISGPGSIFIGGPLTNSGTGSGSTLIGATIFDVGNGLVQNSSTSALALSGANIYSEGTTVSSGTLLVGVSSATTGNGLTLAITNGATGTGPVAVNGGTLDLSTFNLAAGGLNGSGGTIASSSTSSAGSMTIVINVSAQNYSYSGIIADTTGAGSKTVSLSLGGSGFRGAGGAQTLAGANTYSGGTTVNSGDLVVGVSSAMTGSGAALSITSGATGTGLLTVNGGTVDLNRFNLTVAGLAGSGGTIASSSTSTAGSLTIDTGATAETYSGQIANGVSSGNKPVSVTVIGTGSQVLSGNNTYSGGTFLNGGTLTVSGAGALGGGGGPNPVYGPLQVNNPNTGAGTAVVLNVSAASSVATGSLSGTVATPSSGTNTATINVPAGGTLTINQTTPGTFAGTIAGAGTFALGLNSNSTLTLSGTNTFTGGLVIDAGTVSGTNATAFGTSTSSSTGVITLGTLFGGTVAATLSGGFNGTFNNPINVGMASAGSNGILEITDSAASTFSGAVTWGPANSTLTIAPAASDITLTGGFTGRGDLTIANSGTGTTTLSTNSVNIAGQITNSGAGSGGTTISSAIGPNATRVIQNSATSSLSLSGPNTYSGGTRIDAGTLVVSAISDTGISNIGGWPAISGFNNLALGGGTLQYTGAGTSTTTRQVDLEVSSTVLVTGGSLSNLALNGILFDESPNSPKSSLTLGAGSNGILTLGGSNAYTGGTMVNAGTLLVTNTTASATGIGPVNVASGGVLGGGAGGTTGMIGGLVTISGGGNLAPNGSAGTDSTGTSTNLTLNGGLNLSDGSILDYILGTSSDLVTLGDSGLWLNPNVTLNVTQGSGFSAGTTYVLIRYGGLADRSSNFSGWTANGGPSGDTATFSLDAANGDLDVKFIPPSNCLASYSGGPGGPFGAVASSPGNGYAGINSSPTSQTSTTPTANGFGPLLTDDRSSQHNVLYGEILAGSNSGNFTGNGAATVSMAWRNRTLQETTGQEGGTPSSPPLPAANSALISNVLNLTGMSTSGGEPVQTDPFVLQMNYDAALLGNEVEEAVSGAIYLAWLNPNGGRSGVPLWQNAITGDTDGLTTPGIPIYLGSFLNYVNSLDGNANFPLFTTTYTTTTLGNLTNAQLDEILGDWGVDTANHDVWAVIDHNSAFAVAAVPEPATLILAACGFVGLLGYGFRRRRRAHSRTVEHSVHATSA